MTAATVTRFSTQQWPASRRARAWRDCMSQVYFPMDPRPESPDSFRGELTSVSLPRLSLSRFAANAMYTQCPGSTQLPEECVFIFPKRQRFRYSQHGIEADVGPGQMVVLSSADAYWTRIADADCNITIKVPLSIMREQVPDVADGFGRTDLAGACFIPILLQLALQTIRLCSVAPESVSPRMDESLLNLLCVAIEARSARTIPQSSQASLAEISYQRVLSFMACNFADAALSPGHIADALGISTRYVHKLFWRNDTTFGRELLATRLREADRLLKSAAPSGKIPPHIADVAYKCGFSSQSHFSVRYKEHFGCTPREARGPITPG
jgi:AraC-like DNA-binding protein